MISPELLRRYRCFVPSKEESLREMAMIAEEAHFPAGTPLFHEGDPADTLSVIVDGEVDIQYRLQTGEHRTVDTLVGGDILGWSAMVEPYKMTANAIARRDLRLIRVAAGPLRALCERDPSLGHRIMEEVAQLLAERLERARVQLATVA